MGKWKGILMPSFQIISQRFAPKVTTRYVTLQHHVTLCPTILFLYTYYYEGKAASSNSKLQLKLFLGLLPIVVLKWAACAREKFETDTGRIGAQKSREIAVFVKYEQLLHDFFRAAQYTLRKSLRIVLTFQFSRDILEHALPTQVEY